jgi:hypothetical protein
MSNTIFKKITYANNDFGIMTLKYKNKPVPVIVDWKDAEYLNNINKKWHINECGSIVCQHKKDNMIYDLYLHEIIMLLKNKEEGTPKLTNSILHINKVGLDNRRLNLIYDTKDKETNKNLKKKDRIIEFTKESGVKADEMPTFVWYLNPDKTHGERFVVNIGDTNWKTSSSTKLSLRYKLEEAKKYLRELKKFKPDLFDEYSMNGELTKYGKVLLNSFYDITKKANFRNINIIVNDNLTNKYLQQKYHKLCKEEKELISSKSFF